MENKIPVTKWQKIIAGIFSGVLTILILNAIFESGQKKSADSSTPSNPVIVEQQKENLELLTAKSVSDGFARYVIGAVRNNTDRTYGYVQVEINLYDKTGAHVGSTFDNTTNLEPGAIWKFKALILENSATKFKVVKVTGF